MRVIAPLLVVGALVAAEDVPNRPIAEPAAAPATAAPFLRARGASIAEFAEALRANGDVSGVGTPAFAYRVRDAAVVAAAAGEGVEPDAELTANPDYLAAKRAGAFRGGDSRDWWKLGAGDDAKLALYAWAEAWEDPGLRGLQMGHALARAGDVQQAVKAWYAAMLMHPQAQQWSADGQACWPVADLCWGAILDALDAHPELGVRLVDAAVATTAKPGAKERLVAVTPGRFVPAPATTSPPTPPVGKRVAIARDASGGFWLFVDGEPTVVRGVSWGPTPIGVVPWKDHPDAQRDDRDHDGVVDVEQSWLDIDGDGERGADEPRIGDFRILAGLGCNAVRIYADHWNAELLRRVHRETGIRVLVGDFFGAYCVHSGADWERGTDYADAAQRTRMLAAVRTLVETVRGEPWVLGYVLGNENDLPRAYAGVNATRTNAAERPDDYATALQEAAELIHRLDPDHPVGVGSVGLDLIEAYAKHAPALDFIGVNRYVDAGFGSTFARVKAVCDRPVLITEFGAPAYRDGREDQATQARVLAGNWRSLRANALGRDQANALGGFVFEYSDEWWKDTVSGDGADTHSVGKPASGEEWLGICGVSPNDPLARTPRRAFWVLQGLWRER